MFSDSFRVYRWLLFFPLFGTSYSAPVDQLSNDQNLSGVVSNFQDLSAILSLLASDAVEDKILNPRSSDWERMSSVWSLFGIVGVVRGCAKVAVGLSAAEAAGIQLGRASAYTSKKTAHALSSWSVGYGTSCHAWRDDRFTAIGSIKTSSSRWKRPFIIVLGYSRCPFTGWRAVKEVIERLLWAMITLLFACLPTIAIRQTVQGTVLDNIALACWIATSIISGSLFPVMLERLNPTGMEELRDINAARFSGLAPETKRAGSFDSRIGDPDTPSNFDPTHDGVYAQALRQGDAVISSPSHSVSIWKAAGKYQYKRSGDCLTIRCVAALSLAITLAAYMANYFVLGRVETWRTYLWLGVEILILMIRFVFWSTRPNLLTHRFPTILYCTGGSLVPPISDSHASPMPLRQDAVRFAVASAGSKLMSAGGSVSRLDLTALDLLSDTAPSDILQANYREIQSLLDVGWNADDIHFVRLPWSFMDEIYSVQGLILGDNPWVLGGIYLAAIIGNEPDGRRVFLGLTTVHPFDAGGFHGEDVTARKPRTTGADGKVVAGITADNFGISDLVDGVLVRGGRPSTGHQLLDSHTKFRQNIHRCRESAQLNGPGHYEVHTQNFGDGPLGNKYAIKTEESFYDVLKYVEQVVEKEKRKDHASCKSFCSVWGF